MCHPIGRPCLADIRSTRVALRGRSGSLVDFDVSRFPYLANDHGSAKGGRGQHLDHATAFAVHILIDAGHCR